ncbi:uncharacterized protein LOC131667823 [Phymastichus coffea]|uniref:uncharacterized protein LOC131667823 n=1 Tax=Phymastichus coffea TaxID=108790 RepID=UPI00273AB963|nr:uncharacterized protein LOC131667823 [Phymastichus coffea]
MHKLAKGLKKKKKQKKGKKGEDDEEFDPEELERYRRERAEAQQKQAEEASTTEAATAATGNDEWKKFQALTSGIDSVLKKTQDDLDRIKSTSFFQRKAPEPEPDPEESPEQGNPIEVKDEPEEETVKPLPVTEDGIVEVPDDDEFEEEDDIFDTDYIETLQKVVQEVQLAYIPESPTEEELGDDPFDTSNADKVLKTVDKKGRKVVSLGNAVEVLAGRVDYQSTCKIGRNRPRINRDLLLESFDADAEPIPSNNTETEPIEVEKTLLDDDSDLPDIPIDLTQLPPVSPRPITPAANEETDNDLNKPLDISEFESFKDKTLLDEVPTLDDDEFDLTAPDETVVLEEPEDPFAAKEPEDLGFQEEIIEACFEAASIINEDDPFDTTIAANILPGKTELKFIEKELEQVPISEVSISLTDPSGLKCDYETGLLKNQSNSLSVTKKDLLGGSATDLSQLADKPIKPVEEISYVDPFDTSNIQELPPGRTELKVLEKELLGEKKTPTLDDLEDDDFDPRAEEKKAAPPIRPPPITPKVPVAVQADEEVPRISGRKPSRPEALDIAPKIVAFNIPTPKPDLLASSEEEKALPSKPLTPYYPQKSIEEVLPTEDEVDGSDIDPFDTSFVANTAPGKTELKIIESELLAEESVIGISHSVSDQDLESRDKPLPQNRRQSDFGTVTGRPQIIKSSEVIESLINKRKALDKRQDSILDTDVEVAGEPLAPNVKPSTIEEEVELSYKDPFDTSIAENILPGKAELKILENELSQIPEPEPVKPHPVIELVAKKLYSVDEDPDFDPRAEEKDILCQDIGEAPADKILTPIQDSLKMDSKGGNPFLMDDYSAGAEAGPPTSNPFLQDFGDPNPVSTNTDANPFLSFVADTSYQASATDYTNPFASFGAPEAAAVPGPEQNIFITPEVASVPPTTTVNIFEESSVQVTSPPQSIHDTSPPNKPSRPLPPPRPGAPPPPPRNTKDLILSVTGAMDETSNQMLDRLQATRTPSPTLMHSPSPTPEHSFADLLDVDGSVPDLVHDVTSKQQPSSATQDMLGLFDAPAPPSTDQQPVVNANFTTGLTETQGQVEMTVASSTSDEIPATDAPPLTSVLSDNPFSDVGPTEGHVDLGLVQDKRPSLTSGSPVAAEAVAMEMPEVIPTAVVEPTVQEQVPSSGYFNDLSTTDTFQTPGPPPKPPKPAPPPPPTRGANASTGGSGFADLFGAPAQNVAPVSPITATEFPVVGYGAENSTFETTTQSAENTSDAFDAFASKFDKAAESTSTGADPFYDPFTGGSAGHTAMDTSSDVWGDSSAVSKSGPVSGFDDEDGAGFDSFLSMTAPPPDVTPRRHSRDSDEGPDFTIHIKPKEGGDQYGMVEGGPVPVLAPPPKSPMNAAYADSSPRFNPFDKTGFAVQDAALPTEGALPSELTRTDSQETPPTPLFDEDLSQPLEDFPRIHYDGESWEMQLRMPIKKKITGQRFWKKIFVTLVYQGDNPILQIFNNKGDKDPFQELPLLACYSVSEIAAQQYDQYGKIFTVKLQYIFYKERPGVRPGQVTKAGRITDKLSQFAAYAIQGDYQGVKEFGSDLKKLGLPVEHAPQMSQLFKLGSMSYEDLKQFSVTIEEALFRLNVHRDRALTYKMEEVQISVVDEIYVEQNWEGHVEKQIARVRLFFLGFLSGMPDVELGVNDIRRQGKEVVGRHDIIPVATEEWIRLENVEFHSCIQQDEFEKTKIIKFKPPDACYIELLRFRVRPPKNRELPLQLKAVMCVTGNKVELRADILVPGFASRKLGRVPCEDVMVRFPIPECWIYLFRVEKHFRYGSVKSAHRRTGKVKGIERILGAMETLDSQLMETTSGQAKYEHQHRAIVWRMPRLPKEGQGAYTTHQLVCRMNLTSYDQIPEKLAEYCYVEFTMPATQVSHTTARSVSFQNYDGDEPPEKYVRNLSRHEYRVGIEHTVGEGPGAYVAATSISTPKKTATIPESGGESHDESTEHAASDSDSSD